MSASACLLVLHSYIFFKEKGHAFIMDSFRFSFIIVLDVG
jgi:hypothetical protein